MKTCTVTFYYSGNFGGFLQTWALQRFLGESNTLLYFNSSDVDCRFYIKNSRWRKIPFFWRFIALYRYIFKRRKTPDNVRMLRHTRKYYSLKKLIKSPPEADVYIAGSDQIWNSKMFYEETNFEPYFLGFGSPNTKRIAYAASMGGKEWPITYTQKVLPYLKKFHAISVREESSVPFLNSIGLENIAVTCDPTILWTADVYRAYFHLEENENSENIFIYHLQQKYPASIQQFLNGKKTIEFGSRECNKQVPVLQWLYNINNANFVITNSFHGTIFSILFHKPFITFPVTRKNAICGNERVHSLLKKINLQCRLLSMNETETKEEVEKILYSPIDWEQVDKILEEWRIYSANWLRSALEN